MVSTGASSGDDVACLETKRKRPSACSGSAAMNLHPSGAIWTGSGKCPSISYRRHRMGADHHVEGRRFVPMEQANTSPALRHSAEIVIGGKFAAGGRLDFVQTLPRLVGRRLAIFG